VSRPAAITRSAPRRRATWIAIRPALPVGPSTRTSCPARKSIRRRSATHDDMAGFMAAATATGSLSSLDQLSGLIDPLAPGERRRLQAVLERMLEGAG
jgi:hypothetical protein